MNKNYLNISLISAALLSIVNADQVVVVEEGLSEAQAQAWRNSQGVSATANRGTPQYQAPPTASRAVTTATTTAVSSTPTSSPATVKSASAIPLYAAFSAGYLTDASEMYYQAELGYEFKNGFAVYAQANFFSFEESDGGLNTDEDFQSYSLGLKYTMLGSSKWSWSIGGSVGVSNYEADFSTALASGTDDDSVAYFDLFTRAEYAFTAKLSAHLGVRSIFIADREVFGLNLDSGSDTGIEAGLTYRF